jgi:hypothetical protein
LLLGAATPSTRLALCSVYSASIPSSLTKSINNNKDWVMEMYVPKSLYSSKLFLFGFTPWRLRLKKKIRKESELLQMLEDSTDSELSSGSLFHSEESNNASDSENLGDNPEIVDDIQEGGGK